MQSLLEFLTAAPKTFVIKLHRREAPGEGLMQAGRVIHLVFDWALRAERLGKALEEAGKPGRYLLSLIYLSGERGAGEEELLSSQENCQPSQAALLLGRLEQDLLIHSRQGEGPITYHGFAELCEPLLPVVLRDQWDVDGSAAAASPAGPGTAGPGDSGTWISYRHFLASHLCHFLCRAALGEIKVTQTGEMHRKDLQDLSQRFAFGERLSASIPGEEAQFLLRFAGRARLVLQEDGRLYLSEEGKALLRSDRREAGNRLLEWWTTSRAAGITPALRAFAALPTGNGEAARIAPFANLFWIFSGVQRKGYQDHKSTFTWENLPRILQELWLLGLADFGMAKGRIAWIRPAPAHLAPAEAHSRPISLPNLESLVPLDSPFEWQRRLELVGRKSNDEFIARYRFTKDSVIQGLQAGLGLEEFKELLQWLGFEGPACRTLLEWASTYASTLFVDALILKVSDPERFRELQEIPQFLELVTETIPGYGFVLTRQNKAKVRELLQHFGLVPGDDIRRTLNLEPVPFDPASDTWELPSMPAAPPSYRENPLMLRKSPPPSSDRQAQGSREQGISQRIEALEEAIAHEKHVEFSYHGPTPRRITLKPLLILKQKAPIKVIGIESDTGHRNEYLLEQVKSIRVME